MGSKSSGREILYCYIDHDKRRQGPFTEHQMVQWYESGYFSDKLELEVFEVAERLTLLSLKTRNGIISPFKWLEQPGYRNRMPVNVRNAGTQTNFYQSSTGVQTDMKLVGVPAPLLFPLKPPGLNKKPLPQALKTPSHNSNPAASLSNLSCSQRPAIPVQSRPNDLTSQSSGYPDSSKNKEKQSSTYSGEFLPVVNSESSRASSSTSSDFIAAFVPFMFGHTNFKPTALLKGPAFEKAVRKLRAEFTGMTQEHRERFYKKLEELGIPPKIMCKLCNRWLSNYYDYMNHTLSDKHHIAVKEANRSFIDQDYATLQNAIRRTAGHDWIEPINLDKECNVVNHIPLMYSNLNVKELVKNDALQKTMLEDLMVAFEKVDKNRVNKNPKCSQLKMVKCNLCLEPLAGLSNYDFAAHIFTDAHLEALKKASFSSADIEFWKIRFQWSAPLNNDATSESQNAFRPTTLPSKDNKNDEEAPPAVVNAQNIARAKKQQKQEKTVQKQVVKNTQNNGPDPPTQRVNAANSTFTVSSQNKSATLSPNTHQVERNRRHRVNSQKTKK